MLASEIVKLEDKNENLETENNNLDLYNRRNNVEVLAFLRSLTMGTLKRRS